MTATVDYPALHARLQPDRLALCDLASGRRWTYRALDEAIARCAGALATRGVGREDRVAVLAKNRADMAVIHHACARIGAIYVPLNWRLAANEVAGLVQDAEPKLLVGDEHLASAQLSGVSIDAFGAEMEAAAPISTEAVDPDQPSLILYTSGTSGRPKGAILSERNMSETAINFSLLGAVTRDSVFLCDAPMFHVIGLVANIRPAMMRGGAVLVSDGFVPARTLARLCDPELAVTHYFCVPQMAAALRREPHFEPSRLDRLVALFTGGAPHRASDIRAWLADGVAAVDGFGMTEAGTVLGMPLDKDIIDARAGAAGLASPRVQTRIIDAHGADCAVGEAGELLVKGENVTRGYWRRPEETRAAFTEDGWFRTGDIVRRDEDGFHWIVDRCKDMYISGGENVYPAEIEAALSGHAAIAECAVVGTPSAEWGEVGHLFVVPADGASIDVDEIIAELEAQLARYKTPRHVSVIDALPRNAGGKVLKGALRDMSVERLT